MGDIYKRPFDLGATLSFDSPLLASLLAYWREKCAGRAMPARADIDPTDRALRPHLGYIVLTDVLRPPVRFRFRLIGSELTRLVGRDSTGRYMDELYAPEDYTNATEAYSWVVRHRAPLRILGDLRHANRDWLKMESLDLPISNDQAEVDMILTRSVIGGA
jgi:hypothetical protein